MIRKARRGAERKVVMVLTDGEPDDSAQMSTEAQSCIDQNITMLAVGIGNLISYQELVKIAKDGR